MRKLVIANILALITISGGIASSQGIMVRVNGDPVDFYGTQPREYDGRVLVPLRGVLEKMGAAVDWIPADQTVIATRGDMQITLPIGSRTATINHRAVSLDVPAMTIGGSTMVPLRFVGEALGADVLWSSDSRTVSIDTLHRNVAAYRRPRYIDPPIPGARRVVLDAGMVLPVKLDEDLKSDFNQPGDRFTATVERGQDDGGLPDGTKVEGVVREAVPARNGKPGVLDIDFTRIILPDGTSHRIIAGVCSINNTNRNDAGHLVAKSNKKNERLKWVGIGAGAGMLISAVTKGNTLVDSLLGAGAGYLFNELQHRGASNVNLRAGSEFGVRLDRGFSFASYGGS